MKKSYLILVFGAWLCAGAFMPAARADVAFSAGLQISAAADFYDPLASYGAWIDVPRYGRCWHPEGVERDWRPYADGHWEWTDVGWYWVSDEPWSWACYHYGYWTYDDADGWVWIPGTQWAPAWVTWRQSDDYIGWAPCGPRGAVLAPAFFAFVSLGHFHDHFTPSSFIVNNNTIIKRTRVINNIRRENRTIDGARTQVMVNQGPALDRFQQSSGTRFVQRPIRDVVSQTPAPERIRRIQSGPDAIQRPVLREDSSRTRFGNNRNQTPAPATTDRNQRGSTTYRQQQQTTPPTGQDKQRLYRESTPTPAQPTGREQDRIYRESPSAQQPPQERQTQRPAQERSTLPPAATPQTRPDQTERRQPPTERPSAVPPPNEKTLPPTGRDREDQRRQGPGDRVAPPRELPPARETPQPTPQKPERDQNQDKDKEDRHP